MRISPDDLIAEMTRASKQWTVIGEVNEAYMLPPYLLHAVGSRETNLTNEIGDNGHGHGIFQLDDRSHTIPPGFMDDIKAQCTVAAAMLIALFHKYGDWVSACNAYNSGSPLSANTTNGDYGPDVMQRQVFLLKLLGDPVDAVWDVQITDHYQDGMPNAHTMTTGELLSWSATHAAHAKERAADAVAAVDSLRADLPGIITAAIAGAVVKVTVQSPA